MAIYHFASTIASHPYSRAAYNARENLVDPEGNRSVKGLSEEERRSRHIKERRNRQKPQIWDFQSDRSPTVWSAILSGDPDNLPPEGWAASYVKDNDNPDEYRERLQKLVDKVADKETTGNGLFRKNAQFFREIVVSLPHELAEEENIDLACDFVNKHFVSKGMIAVVDIHNPDSDGDRRNIHAHILLTMRSIDEDGFGPKVREWNDRDLFKSWRENWAHFVADRLENKSHLQEAARFRVAHLTLGEQYKAAVGRGDAEYAESLDRPATRYKGPVVTLRERKEEKTRKIKDSFDTTARQLAKQHKHTEREARKLKADFTVAARGKTVPTVLKGRKKGPGYQAVRRRILEKLLRDFKTTAEAITRKKLSIVFYAAAELLVQGRSSLARKPKAPAVPPAGPPPVSGGGSGGGGSSGGAPPKAYEASMASAGPALVSTSVFERGVSVGPFVLTPPPSGPPPVSRVSIAAPPAIVAVPSEPDRVFTGRFEGKPGEADVGRPSFVMETTVPAVLFEQAEGPTGFGGKSWGEHLVVEFGREQFKRTTQGLNADITVHRIRHGEGIPNEYRMRVVVTTPPQIAEDLRAALTRGCIDKWERLVHGKLSKSGNGSLSASPLRPVSISGPDSVSGSTPGEGPAS